MQVVNHYACNAQLSVIEAHQRAKKFCNFFILFGRFDCCTTSALKVLKKHLTNKTNLTKTLNQ